MLPDCSDFTSYFLETRAGQPDSITGVPPSLYTLTVTNFISQPGRCVVIEPTLPLCGIPFPNDQL